MIGVLTVEQCFDIVLVPVELIQRILSKLRRCVDVAARAARGTTSGIVTQLGSDGREELDDLRMRAETSRVEQLRKLL